MSPIPFWGVCRSWYILEKAEQRFQFLFELSQGFPTIVTGFGSKVEIKVLAAACTDADIYIDFLE
jgi:hypothetical protein